MESCTNIGRQGAACLVAPAKAKIRSHIFLKQTVLPCRRGIHFCIHILRIIPGRTAFFIGNFRRRRCDKNDTVNTICTDFYRAGMHLIALLTRKSYEPNRIRNVNNAVTPRNFCKPLVHLKLHLMTIKVQLNFNRFSAFACIAGVIGSGLSLCKPIVHKVFELE